MSTLALQICIKSGSNGLFLLFFMQNILISGSASGIDADPVNEFTRFKIFGANHNSLARSRCSGLSANHLRNFDTLNGDIHLFLGEMVVVAYFPII